MIKKILVLSIFLFLLIYSTAFSYQFEDYKWGTSYDESLRKVEESGKNISKRNDNLIMYSDKIVNSPCDVILGFTPKSKLLATVSVIWNGATVSYDLKELLTKKYGQPRLSGISGEYYFGQGSDNILLKVTSDTNCSYFGGIYWDKYNEEKSQINSTDANRF